MEMKKTCSFKFIISTDTDSIFDCQKEVEELKVIISRLDIFLLELKKCELPVSADLIEKFWEKSKYRTKRISFSKGED